MPNLLTSATAAVIFVVGVTAAQAQLAPSVANLPPQGTTTAPVTAPVAPSPKYVGVAPGGPESANFGAVSGSTGVAASPKFVGVAPGGPEGANYAAPQKPAGYDGDGTMRPYTTSGMGPKPN